VGKEKEGLVFDDRTTQHAAEVVHPLGRLLEAVEVHEPVLGVQHVISEVFEERAMEGVSSGARHDRDLRAGGATELWRKRRRLDAELLHRIHRHQAVGAARGAERRQRSARGLDHYNVTRDAKIGADSVYGEIVGIRALPIHAKLSLVVEGGGG